MKLIYKVGRTGSGCQQSSTTSIVVVRLGTLKPQVLRRPGVQLSTPWLAINVDRQRYSSLTSCVVADRLRRRLSALFVDAVGHCLDRLALSSATAVGKI